MAEIQIGEILGRTQGEMMAAEQQEWTVESIRAEVERLQAAERVKYFQDAEPEPAKPAPKAGAGQDEQGATIYRGAVPKRKTRLQVRTEAGFQSGVI